MAKTETELLGQVKYYSKGINEISNKLRSKTLLSKKRKADLEKKIKQLACFRRDSLQLLMCLQEQKKIS